MSARDPFGTPGWDALRAGAAHSTPRSGRDHFPPHQAAAEVIHELVRRQAADRAAREEAAIRAALTARVRDGIEMTLDGHPAIDKARRADIYHAAAEAAVSALEQFYKDGHTVMKGAR